MALIDSIMLFNKAYDMARPVEYYLDCNERVIALSDLAKLLDNMPTIEPETEEEAYERGYTAGQMAQRKKGKWIDDVLPKSVGAPNTAKDRDPQAIFDGFLPKGMTPDDMLETKIIDILP